MNPGHVTDSGVQRIMFGRSAAGSNDRRHGCHHPRPPHSSPMRMCAKSAHASTPRTKRAISEPTPLAGRRNATISPRGWATRRCRFRRCGVAWYAGESGGGAWWCLVLIRVIRKASRLKGSKHPAGCRGLTGSETEGRPHARKRCNSQASRGRAQASLAAGSGAR
jgi:hypothetical protein